MNYQNRFDLNCNAVTWTWPDSAKLLLDDFLMNELILILEGRSQQPLASNNDMIFII